MQKLIIITLAILFTLTICGAVSAADNTTNNSTTTNVSTGNSSNSLVNSSQNSSVQGSIKNETLPDPRIEHNGVIGSTVYTTIQAAIDAAQAGDTIWLESGTYTTTTNYANPALVYITKSLTFKVFNGGTATINGSGTYRCVYVNSGVTATFYNITITNGKSYYGAGIFNNGTLNLNNCTLTGNTAITNPNDQYNSNYGGAIWNAATCNVYNCTFTGNTASYGGAIENYDGIMGSTTSSNTLTVSGSTFTGNTATGTNTGGAVDNWNGLSLISFSRIINNGLYDLYCIYGTLDARYNWWGSNSNPSARTSKSWGNLIVSNWLVLTITASPTSVQNGETSTITADLLHDNTGTYHDPALGHVPDGISVTFGPSSPSYGYYTTTTSTKTSNGQATATFQANDPDTPHTQSLTAAVDSQTSSTNIRINTPPTVPDYSVTTQEDTAVSGQVDGSDVDGDSLTYSVTKNPSHGTITSFNPNTGAWTYMPSGDYNGDDSFEVTVSDGFDTAISKISAHVTAVNDAPVANDDSQTIDEDNSATGHVTATDVDGDSLIYTLGTGSSAPQHGTVSLNSATGSYTYTPNANWFGADVFTVIVSDGHGGTDEATVTITVNSVNDVPVAQDGTATTDEDTSVSGSVTATDVDGDSLTYTLGTGSSAPQHGTVSLNSATGAYTYTPNANWFGADVFTVIVSDGHGGTDEVTVTITVNPVNDAPVAVDDTASTYEDTGLTSGDVTGNDIPSGDGGNVWSVVSGPDHGTLVMNADGTYTYTPYANYNGHDEFTYQIMDVNGDISTAKVDITIISVNDVPVAVDDTASTNEETRLTGNVADNDFPSGDGGNVWSLVSGPAHTATGYFILHDDGNYVYIPDTDYNGLDQFTYKITDANGDISTATMTITVTPVNDPPTVGNYDVTTQEDTSTSGTVIGSDVDSTLTYSVTKNPSHGTITSFNPNTGAWTYMPSGDYNGDDSFEVTVSDGLATAISKITIHVTPVNDVPVAQDGTATTDEDTSVSGSVTGSDVDGDSLTYAKGSDPAHGSVTVDADGSYTYTPEANWYGTDSFTYIVTDGKGGSDTATVTITVNPVNDAPVAQDGTATTDEDTSVSGSVTGSDVDGDSLTYAKGSDPAHGTAVVNSDGTYTYTPDANWFGADVFTVIVSDGHGGTDEATVTITVNSVNDVPVAAGDSQTTDEDTSVSGSVTATDVDGDSLIYTLGIGSSAPQHGTVSLNSATGDYIYTPDADYNGDDQFDVTVSDGNGGFDTVTVYIHVNPVNDAPVAQDGTATTDEDTSVSGSVTGSDVDGDSLTYAKGSDPAHGSVTVDADGSYTYTPEANWYGTDSFTYIVTDGKGGSDTATVTVTVNSVNDVPMAVDDSATVDEDGSVSGNVFTNDAPSADGGNVWSKATDPAHGTATVNADGSYTYTPDANYHGTDSFDYMITDVDGSTSTATVYITVNSVNDVPVANNDSANTKEDTKVNIDVLDNDSDVDGDSLTVTGVSDPAHGTAIINADGTVTYTPDADYYGDDSFTYTVNDGNGGEATGTVNITVDRLVASIYVLTTLSKTNPAAGETVTLNFKLGNSGPDSAKNTVFTYVIPEGMEFVSLETEKGYPEAVYNSANRAITWNLGTVPILDPWLKLNLKVLKASSFNINPTVTTSTYDPTLESSVQGVTLNAVDAADTSNQDTGKKTTVNAQTVTSKTTMKMKDTGLPLNYLILAILMVIGGLVPRRRK